MFKDINKFISKLVRIDGYINFRVQRMQCYIYKSLIKDLLFLYVDKKDDFSNVPVALLDSIGEPVFVMALELTPEQKLARENPEKIISQLKEKGFFIQMPPTQFPAPETIQ